MGCMQLELYLVYFVYSWRDYKVVVCSADKLSTF